MENRKIKNKCFCRFGKVNATKSNYFEARNLIKSRNVICDFN